MNRYLVNIESNRPNAVKEAGHELQWHGTWNVCFIVKANTIEEVVAVAGQFGDILSLHKLSEVVTPSLLDTPPAKKTLNTWFDALAAISNHMFFGTRVKDHATTLIAMIYEELLMNEENV